MSHKTQIARRFGQAAAQYDAAAEVQAEIAQETLDRLAERVTRVLDIGCGTGRVTQRLAARSEQTIGLDLAHGMLTHASAHNSADNIYWLTGDAEALPFAAAQFDGVFSSMALQWCEDWSQTIAEIYRVLTPGGVASLSVLCDGALSELRDSWQAIDGFVHVNQFPSAETLVSGATGAGFQVASEQQDFVTLHESIIPLLKSIKAIGANQVTAGQGRATISRGTLHGLENHYQQRFGISDKLPLTYRVCLLTLRKPD